MSTANPAVPAEADRRSESRLLPRPGSPVTNANCVSRDWRLLEKRLESPQERLPPHELRRASAAQHWRSLARNRAGRRSDGNGHARARRQRAQCAPGLVQRDRIGRRSLPEKALRVLEPLLRFDPVAKPEQQPEQILMREQVTYVGLDSLPCEWQRPVGGVLQPSGRL